VRPEAPSDHATADPVPSNTYHHPDYGPVTFDKWLYGRKYAHTPPVARIITEAGEVKNCPVDELTGGDQRAG